MLKINPQFLVDDKGEKTAELLTIKEFQLVSSNRNTMPVHLHEHLQKGRHIPGILLLRPKAYYQKIIDTLELIFLASVPEDFRDQIAYIPY